MNNINVFSIFAALCFSTLLQAQTVSESRSLSAFDQLLISNSIEAELVAGDQYEVTITASGIDPGNVETKVNKRKLEISVPGSNPKSSSVKVVLTYVKLDDVEVDTGARVILKNALESKSIRLQVASNGYLEAEVNADDLYLRAQTNSKMYVKGKANNLDYNAFTNAEIDGEDLQVTHAEVRTNTNASGSFEVTESLKGSAATRGRVKYKGTPNVIDIKETVGGAIEKW
ncbi:GIN domain-containing protein [Cyclobacterium xiamenense]|uniref:GIN domain-containing protein n=1 Tax=Cyclobacterium xiamenense TaxID=1297121 RepID=UPI0012B8DF26|nr:DUF2807 domain-containing protein [Cyclobacterium xiamenense]